MNRGEERESRGALVSIEQNFERNLQTRQRNASIDFTHIQFS